MLVGPAPAWTAGIVTRMSIGIIGLGYVGLPLAVAFAEAGEHVIAVDIDPAKVEAITAGKSYIEDIDSARLSAVASNIEATTAMSAVASAEAVLICVPTPLTRNREPDLTPLLAASRSLAEVAQAGQLIVLESTADLRPDRWEIGADGLGIIEIGGVTIKPPVRGLHNLRNAMLALAVARECGVSYEDATQGIATMPQPKMRVAWEQVGNVTLINDAYNANPGSTRAAIELLQGTGTGRQRVIVLGTMRELGAASEQCHADIAGLALASGADIVAGIGEFAPALEKRKDRERVITASDVEDLWPQLEGRLQRDAIILLKASRGVQLERLVPHLTTWATA